MLPYLFAIGPYQVPTHGFFVLLGTLAATVIFLYEARRRHMIEDRLIGVMLGTLLCGTIGAKLSTLWMYIQLTPNPSLLGLIVDGGKSILGGLAAAYLGAYLFKWLLGYRQHTGDLFAPAVALGMAIGRIGCFLTEQIGTPTSLPWGISLSPALAARVPDCPYCLSGVAMHPSFLYEIIFHLAMFVALWCWLRPRVYVNGELLKIYLLAYAVFRFWVEFVRGNEVVWNGLTRSQLFLIPSTLLLVGYFVRQWRRGVYQLPTLDPAIREQRKEARRLAGTSKPRSA